MVLALRSIPSWSEVLVLLLFQQLYFYGSGYISLTLVKHFVFYSGPVWHHENPNGTYLDHRCWTHYRRLYACLSVSLCSGSKLGFYCTRDLEAFNLKDWSRFSTIWLFVVLLHESVGTLKLRQPTLSHADILCTGLFPLQWTQESLRGLVKIQSSRFLLRLLNQTIWEWRSKLCFLKQTIDMI